MWLIGDYYSKYFEERVWNDAPTVGYIIIINDYERSSLIY